MLAQCALFLFFCLLLFLLSRYALVTTSHPHIHSASLINYDSCLYVLVSIWVTMYYDVYFWVFNGWLFYSLSGLHRYLLRTAGTTHILGACYILTRTTHLHVLVNARLYLPRAGTCRRYRPKGVLATDLPVSPMCKYLLMLGGTSHVQVLVAGTAQGGFLLHARRYHPCASTC